MDDDWPVPDRKLALYTIYRTDAVQEDLLTLAPMVERRLDPVFLCNLLRRSRARETFQNLATCLETSFRLSAAG